LALHNSELFSLFLQWGALKFRNLFYPLTLKSGFIQIDCQQLCLFGVELNLSVDSGCKIQNNRYDILPNISLMQNKKRNRKKNNKRQNSFGQRGTTIRWD